MVRHTQMLLLVFVHPPGGAGGDGHGSRPGLGASLIRPGSRLEACNTALIRSSTVVSREGLFPHVAHESRAAMIAPCCAAWVMVE